ncbi:MAG TPA: hypothetical protein VGW33_09245 [Terriglobia bacterium]|nr:hypothetical protein [Terriglobia bacterium]
MNSLMNDVQHEAQRGLMLRILVDWHLEWMPFNELRVQMMRRTGDTVTDERLKFHLAYLTQNQYAETKQLRAGRAEIELTAVRGTPKAVDLLEGRLAPDAGIAL